MPYVRLPDGTYYQAPEGMDYPTAVQTAMKAFPDAFGIKPPPPPPAPAPSTFGSELGRGFS